MIEWPLLVASGLLGSAHCLGMCGPFALVIGSANPAWRTNLTRQSAWAAGRLFTYAVLGAAAGFVGLRVVSLFPGGTNVPAILAIAAGALLVFLGLSAAGVIPRRGVGVGGCPGGGALRALLTARGTLEVFLAGMFTGLLPCGLLYGMLTLAAATHDVSRGLLTMAAFGLGTVPALLVAGLGGSILGLAARRHLHTFAAWCLVLTGCVSIARGAGYVHFGDAEPAGCPLCAPEITPVDGR